jgi:hypothetical protein
VCYRTDAAGAAVPPARGLGNFQTVSTKHRLAAGLLSNRPATPARGLGNFQTVSTKHRLAAGLGGYLRSKLFLVGESGGENVRKTHCAPIRIRSAS